MEIYENKGFLWDETEYLRLYEHRLIGESS